MFGRLKSWLKGRQMDSPIVDVGLIKRRDGSIDSEEWRKLVESHRGLEQAPDRYGTNPFTKEVVLFPGKGAAICTVDGKKQGTLLFSNGEVSITNVPEHFCNEIAALLKAEVRPGLDAYCKE